MESVVYVFNIISNIVKDIVSGFLEFFNTIPVIFQNMESWVTNLFPADFSAYLVALIPIIVTLLIIKFVRG